MSQERALAGEIAWGKWRFHPRNSTLRFEDGGDYEIDLETMVTAEHALNWIAQFAGKRWATPADVGHLVRALDNIFILQASFCWALDPEPKNPAHR